jgi:hypothetical protein
MERKEVLNRAVVAAKEKDYVTARKILQGLLKQNSQDVDALLLFALVANKKEHAVQALKKILKIDPSHKIAREKLAQLEPSTSIPATPKPQLAPPIAQSFSDPIKEEKISEVEEKTGTNKKRRRWVEPVLIGALLCACACMSFAVLGEMSNKGILPQAATSVPTPTESQIFFVLYENIDAMNDRSLPRYMATIHPDSAVYNRTEEALKESFELFVLKSYIGELEIVRQTSTRVEVAFVLTTRKVRGPAFRENQVIGVMTLKKDKDDGDKWKIYSQTTDDVIYLD